MTAAHEANIRRLLAYDPKTGELRWREKPNRKIPVGSVAGTKHDSRWSVWVDGKRHLAHRLAWLLHYGKWPDYLIDHIDGNPLNNCIANLRDVTQSVNMQNQRRAQKTNTNGLLGVTPSRCGKKWSARIVTPQKRLYLGTFSTPEAAHAAYVQAKRVHHEGGTL